MENDSRQDFAEFCEGETNLLYRCTARAIQTALAAAEQRAEQAEASVEAIKILLSARERDGFNYQQQARLAETDCVALREAIQNMIYCPLIMQNMAHRRDWYKDSGKPEPMEAAFQLLTESNPGANLLIRMMVMEGDTELAALVRRLVELRHRLPIIPLGNSLFSLTYSDRTSKWSVYWGNAGVVDEYDSPEAALNAALNGAGKKGV